MANGIFLTEQNAKAIKAHADYLLDLPDNHPRLIEHNQLLNQPSFSTFITKFTVELTQFGLGIDAFNQSLVQHLTETFLFDVEASWFKSDDAFYIPYAYYIWLNDTPASPYIGDNAFSVVGDIFNNFPLTVNGKMHADELNAIVKDEFQAAMYSTCLTLALKESNL